MIIGNNLLELKVDKVLGVEGTFFLNMVILSSAVEVDVCREASNTTAQEDKRDAGRLLCGWSRGGISPCASKLDIDLVITRSQIMTKTCDRARYGCTKEGHCVGDSGIVDLVSNFLSARECWL